MNYYKKTLLGLTEKRDTLRATLVLRLIALVLVVVALPARTVLPMWMAEWYRLIFYPLFLYNVAFLVFHSKVATFLQKHPSVLLIDLSIAIGILQIGGGWRSSYFVYTLTTIMLFTIFDRRRGAYASSIILAAAAIIKDPAGGLPSLEIFDATNWDIRLGAALFYIAAGCILAYFSTLLDKLEVLSEAKIEETRKRTAMEEKMRLALDLHDSVKSKITAMLLVLKPLLKRTDSCEQDVDDELRRLWRWLNYLQTALNHVVDSLKSEAHVSTSSCNVVALAEEEAKIAGGMTGLPWRVLCNPREIYVPIKTKQSLTKFFTEALMNSWKHSGATTGVIELSCSGESITIVVSDNGKGFAYSDSGDTETTGLESLKYRARELNGNLNVETAPGRGCKLILTFPATGRSKKLP